MLQEASEPSSVVAAPGRRLVTPPPARPGEGVPGRAGRAGQGGVGASDLVDAQRDEAVAIVECVGLSPGVGGDDGEPRMSQHGERDVAVPGVPETNLVLVEADLILAGLEALLDCPPHTDDGDQFGQRGAGR